MQSVSSLAPGRLGHSFLSLKPLERCSRCILQLLVDWATRCGCLTLLQSCSRCILHPRPAGPLVKRVFPRCRDAVDVFYCPRPTGPLVRGVLLRCRDTVNVFYIPRCGCLTLLQSCSRCILYPRPARPLVRVVLPWCRDAVGVFYSPGWLGHSLREFLPRYRDAVDVFCCLSLPGYSANVNISLVSLWVVVISALTI